MGKGGAALGIIGMILGAGGIGFAFVVWNGQNTTNSDFNNLSNTLNNLTQTIFVGIWEGLDHNLDFAPYNSTSDWLFEFEDNQLNNTDYISVSNTNTRITLLKSGWYRFHLSVLLTNVDSSYSYYISLLKDGTLESYFDFFRTSSTFDAGYEYIDSSAFVYSDGTNYIELEYFSTDNYFVPGADLYNQLTIEYVVI